MTDIPVNETTPFVVVPEQVIRPNEQAEKQETSTKMTSCSEQEEEGVREKANTSSGTTTASGDDQSDASSGIVKTETPSPAARIEAEEALPSGVEKVEKSEAEVSDSAN
jgi:hypothetical protein